MVEKKEKLAEIIPYQQNDNIFKANSLITAKYRSTLLENKVFFACLWAVQNRQLEETDRGYEVVLAANELKEITQSRGGSFYENLKPVAQSLVNYSFGIESPEDDYFSYINLISECTYEKGEFRITFGKKSKDLIMGLSKNYTTLPTLMMKFKSVYGFRLYEILKRYCYYKKDVPAEKRDNVFTVEKNINELKLELGTVNSNLHVVRKELENKEFPDYEKAVEKSPEEIYSRFADFNRYVLKQAVKEINAISDMKVSYKANRGGKSKQTYSITFVMDLNQNKEKIEVVTETKDLTSMDENQLFEFHMEVANLFGGRLKLEDIRAISKAASYNMEKIYSAKEKLDMQRGTIDNVIGWMISCIKEDYQNSTWDESDSKTSFSNFPQRGTDYSEIEKRLYNI